jgi:3-oxoacyl-[acyl-carrier-protein] synthase II
MSRYVRPAVTGVGVVTCLGDNMDEVWQRLFAGESGLRPITLFDASRSRSQLGGEVPDVASSSGLERMSRLMEQAMRDALQEAGICATDLQGARAAVIAGTSLGHLFENASGPVVLDEFLPEVLAVLDLHGLPVLNVSSACSSGTDAIGIAADLIEFAGYDAVICGGVDVLDLYKLMGHSSLYTLSPNGCRPFSLHKDGTSLGEGAAFLVLESAAYAERRHATVLARLVGRSATTDTHSVTAPDETGGGAIRALRQALEQSGSVAENVSYLNAHGSGTPTNDKMEAVIYRELFAASQTPVSSTKAAFGHMLGATGAMEAVVAVWSLLKGEAPPVAGVTEADEDWRETGVILGEAPRILPHPELAVSATYGFGGAISCLVFGKEEGREGSG